jgi:hypothetical protein
MWVGTDSLFTSRQPSAWNICDFWQMRDGDFVTVTNRWADLPEWFELYPSEVANAAGSEIMKQLNEGYQPKEPLNGPNIWRMKAGDRLVWVATQKARQPVRSVLDLRACVLAIGENSTPSITGLSSFGAPQGKELPAAEAAAMRAGFDVAVSLGVPRMFAAEWRFGA